MKTSEVYILKGSYPYEEDEDIGFFTTKKKAEAYKEALIKDGLYLKGQLTITIGPLNPEFPK